ncbi:Ig-like domain-containing protein [Prolixibacteraceae bacterium Z1-6]|uniref:Ig-like domain-containing protein n=1 Tax=Draconibacterium aestuarii TaxID=2998507 RepID=A0A9X3F393_9BACT|nr:Ig-like domain-containing protein [Prolixibacteraceae bacterium Z1-6]
MKAILTFLFSLFYLQFTYGADYDVVDDGSDGIFSKGSNAYGYMKVQTYADVTPPSVTSITLSGLPLINSSLVTFSVGFDESAYNISTDDFQVTTVSDNATGYVSSVSNSSGTMVNVTVHSISGTGIIRLDLKSNTNIVDSSGNGNGTNGYAAEYTSGSTHTVDRDPPSAPSAPDLDTGSDSGISNTDNITNENIPTFTGTADPNSTVTVLSSINGILGTTTADAGGNWYFVSYNVLSDGLHNITTTATDAAGNTSSASSALAITIDSTEPSVPSTPALVTGSDSGLSNTDNITNVTTPTFTGTAEANSTITVISSVDGMLGTTTTDIGGNWYFVSFSALSEGSHNITATVTDVAGNISSESSALTITTDTSEPSAPSTPDLHAGSDSGVSNTDNITNDNTPTFTGTAEANSTVTIISSVDGSLGTTIADDNGNWSFTSYRTLSEESHNITAIATDVAGNTSSESSALAITIDTASPEAKCKNISIGLDQNGQASITAAQLDRGSTDNHALDKMWLDRYNFSITNMGDNLVTLYVSDIAGNLSSCTAVVKVEDNIAPKVNCNKITIYLDENGEYPLTDDDLLALSNGTTDNVTAIEDLDISAYVYPKALNCNENGHQVAVQVMAIDNAGNQGECVVLVDVLDTLPLTVNNIDDIEVMVGTGKCDTTITYPELITSNKCADFTQVSGLGPYGDFPIGTTEEKWLLSNTQGNSLEFSFFVTVTAENIPPTLDSIEDIDITGLVTEFVVPLTGITYGDNCIEQDILITATGMNQEIISAINVNYTSPETTGELILSIPPFARGWDIITVTVEDSDGAATSQTFFVMVNHTNQAPEETSLIPDQEVIADRTLALNLGDFFDDPDGDMLTYEVSMEDGSALPDWISNDGDTLFAMPSISNTGCVSIVVSASDPFMVSVSDTFQVCALGYPTGIDDIDSRKLSMNLYPNPSRGMVTLELETPEMDDAELTVTNTAGIRIFHKTYRNQQLIQFNLSDQLSGLYLVNLKIGDQYFNQKLILRK